MSVQQDNWVYLDEELPEIYIREIVSIEELLEKNPNFVALSDEEIYNTLLRMFEERPAIADTYFDLHKNITNPTDRFERYFKHIIYNVNAKRKAFDTEESEQEYFSTLENIKKNPSYGIREQIKAELHEPFEKIESIENENKINIPRGKRILINLTSEESGENNENIRLEADKENYSVLSGNFYEANHVNNMYIHEHIEKSSVRTLTDRVVSKKDVDKSKIIELAEKEGSNKTDLDYFTIFTKTIVPSFKYIINQINPKNTSNIHSLRILFELYGRNLEDIDIDTYYDLYDTIKSLDYTDIDEVKAEEAEEAEEVKKDKEEEEEKKKKVVKKEKKGVKEKAVKKEKVKKKKGGKIEIEKRDIKISETSYVKLHKLFWDSVISRLNVASDAPLYSELINNAIAMVLAKPFKTELYIPLSKKLQGLENGSYKLDEFIKDIQMLRNLDERMLLSEFRVAVQALQGSGETKIFTDLENAIMKKSTFSAKTLDPEQAHELFNSGSFVKEYTDKDELKKGFEPIDETLGADIVGHFVVESVDAYVENKPENEDDVELEEEEDELTLALEKYNTSPMGKILSSLSEILTRIQRLTNMPWNPHEFIKMMIQRAPPIIDIGIAMYEINNNIRKDIIDKITESSLEEAIKILPIDQHTIIKSAYQKAGIKLKEQRNKLFFMFISYWIIHVQSLMLDDMFLLQEITNGPCKSELTGIGFPIEEGREGKKGVLKYFVCILHDEGHDIPNIHDLVDDYSNEQLIDMIKVGFIHFTHEIDAMKKQAYREVVYQGKLMVDEANEAYDTIIKLKKQKIFTSNELLKPYIKSLQLLPSILRDVKERHKHILGCCYTRLDLDYLAANNLSKRLIASKNFFARERIGQKRRPGLIYYGIPIIKTEFKKLEKDLGMESIKEEPLAAEPIIDWKESVVKMPFIPQNIKDKIMNIENRQIIQQLDDESNRYLEALYKTTNTQMDKKMLKNMEGMSIQEIFGLFTQVCFDFYMYSKNLKEAISGSIVNPKMLYEIETNLIDTEVQKAKDIMDLIKSLTIPENEIGELKSIVQYVFYRTLCLPGDVEHNKKTITINRVVKSNFIEDTASYIGKELKRHVEMRSTPSMEEIEKKISEIREKNKIESIKKYELNPELNKIIKQAKLQGIRIDIESTGATLENIVENITNMQTEDERADLEGALEFEMRTQDPDEANVDNFYDW